jgi:hypothetical protein
MKYQKPVVHDLSQLSFAEGACTSGLFVGDCSPNGLQAGQCISVGNTAGVCTTAGNTVNATACSANGIMGTGAPNCNPHGQIAQV